MFKKMGVTIKKKGKIFYVYGKGLGSLFAKKEQSLTWKLRYSCKIIDWNIKHDPDIDIKLSGDTSLKKEI